MKILLDFGVEHPARTIDFDELVQGLFEEVSNGNINVNYHPEFPHLALFKYSQDCVTEKRWNKFTIMARGLILDLKNKKVVATPFIKFWNCNEIINYENFFSPEFLATEKVDGCCDQDTKLETEDGVMTIREICESEYLGKVLSYNIYDDKIEFKEILGHSVLKGSDDWYELETKEGDIVKLTGNHKVYLPEFNCYRRVDELNGNEKLYFLIKEMKRNEK